MNTQYVSAPPTGKTYLVVGDLVKVLVTRKDTHDAYVAFETITNPGGGMPILHTHPAQETFFVLEGKHEIYRQDEDGSKLEIQAGPGSVVHVPGNAPHGYTNVDDKQGRVIMILDGVGKMDDFFAEIGIPVEDLNNPPTAEGPPDMAWLIGVCTRYGMTFVEAPPV